jgi:hypothetical protein
MKRPACASTASCPVPRAWTLVCVAFLGVAAIACGEGEEGPSPPSPTPTAVLVREGWLRHTTAGFQVDLPKTWDAFDLTEEDFEAIVERLSSWKPAFASLFERVVAPEVYEFFACDSESVDFVNNLSIMRVEEPSPITLPALIMQLEDFLPDVGITVLATDPDLTIGGVEAGSIQASTTFGPYDVRQVQYIVRAKPDLWFGLMLSASADDFDALEPVFGEIAESFRVLELR